ncbi:beta-2-microglobulin-like [Rhinoraja longicauda]
MRTLILLSLVLLCVASPSPPQIAVYTNKPLELGVENFLLCHAKEFNPPNIEMKLLMDGAVLPGANKSDLSFEKNWRFKLTTFIKIIPKKGVEYSCRVWHNGTTSVVKLDSF